jgi:hypothetical protein
MRTSSSILYVGAEHSIRFHILQCTSIVVVFGSSQVYVALGNLLFQIAKKRIFFFTNLSQTNFV